MRLFVYLLALLTGLSAAHASPEKMRAAAALDNAPAATACVTQDTAAISEILTPAPAQNLAADADIRWQGAEIPSLQAAPRIYRGDRSRE